MNFHKTESLPWFFCVSLTKFVILRMSSSYRLTKVYIVETFFITAGHSFMRKQIIEERFVIHLLFQCLLFPLQNHVAHNFVEPIKFSQLRNYKRVLLALMSISRAPRLHTVLVQDS
jgi:hypothetical protein